MSLIESFLEMMMAERGARPNTVQSYRRDLADFAGFITPKRIVNAQRPDLEAYLAHLTGKGFAQTTLSRRLSALKQFYNFLVSEEDIAANPADSILAPKQGRSLPKTLSTEDVNQLITVAAHQADPEGIRLYAMLEVLYSSGLRVSELVSLPISALVVDPITKEIQRVLRITGKGGKERLAPLSKPAIKALKTYMKVRPSFLGNKDAYNPWFFPSYGQSGHLTRQRFGQLLKDLGLKAGLNTNNLSPHIVRHAFATHLLQNGADLLSIQKLLGHADISTTQIYTHIANKQVQDLVHQHHPLVKKS